MQFGLAILLDNGRTGSIRSTLPALTLPFFEPADKNQGYGRPHNTIHSCHQIPPENIPAIGVIGGSGLYQIEGLSEPEEKAVTTPFGEPSDVLMAGRLAGRRVFFLPRHGRGHRIMPHEVNHRANLYALRSLGVRWIICVTAVGSLQEQYATAAYRAAFAVL